jgi:hypothetical protein
MGPARRRTVPSCAAASMPSTAVQRVVPDLKSEHLDQVRRLYAHVLGLEPVMDHGWIVTFADPGTGTCQIS